MITLFVGRFQPFHNGHLSDINKASKFSDKIIIGVGSSQESGTKNNPFTFEQRRQMIKKSLSSEISYEIIPIPDVNHDEKWTQLVLKNIFDIVYSGNPLVKKLFEKTKIIKDVELLPGISGTEIRNRIIKDQYWQSLVPLEVSNYLMEIQAESIIQNLSK